MNTGISRLGTQQPCKRTVRRELTRGIKLGKLMLAIAVAAVVMITGAPAADAAVTMIDAFPATPQINDATTSPATAAYTPSAGTNRLIVVEVTNIPNNTTVTTISVTYGSNNVPATYVIDSANNQRRQAWLFYLTEADIAAASGNTITVTNDNAVNFSVNIAAFAGVDQITPVTAFDGQYINNTAAILNYTAPLSVNAGGYGIIAAGSNTTGGTIGESYVDHGETAVGTGFSRLGSLAFAAGGTTDPGIDYGGTTVRAGVVGMTLNPAPVAGPGTLSLVSATYTVGENAGTVVLEVARTGGVTGAVGVAYATANGTAISGSDYTAASGSLSWAGGDSANKTITISIINDTTVETSEDFNVTLSSPTGGAVLGTPFTSTVTITDDDGAPAAQVPAGNLLLFASLAGGMLIYGGRLLRKKSDRGDHDQQ
ncbi:MAG: hypothetical protein OEW15_08060 [Nitrospirota bacterium]|nr:hypothetical protein [Nitrospirota bacterium]